MTDDSLLLFDVPAVCRKKVTAAFDGGLISSVGGLVLLREAERRCPGRLTTAGPYYTGPRAPSSPRPSTPNAYHVPSRNQTP